MAGVDESGATMQRPRVAVPLTYHANRLSQMESEPKAVDHNGTVRSALIGLGRGALAGFQRGGLGGALFGAAAGGIQGGFNPAADEQYQQKRDIAHEQATFADIYGRTKGQSDLQNDETKRQLELASAYDKLHPKPTYRPLTTDKGIVFYDQSDPTARIDSGLKLPAKPEPYHAPILRDRTLPDGSKQTEKFNETTGQFEPVKSGDKPFISAPKPTSVGSDGLTPYQRAELRLRQQGITYQHNRDAAADTRSQRSYIEGVHKDFTSRVQQARGLVSQFEYNKARAASESDPAKRQQAVDGMNSAYQALQSYDDVYELGAGGGSPYVKPREGRSVSQVIRANPKLTPEQAVQMILDQHYVPTR
jgi:hypothetical protein